LGIAKIAESAKIGKLKTKTFTTEVTENTEEACATWGTRICTLPWFPVNLVTYKF